MLPPGTWVLRIPLHHDANTSVAFTNMPLADTFLFAASRHIAKVDISGMTQVRLLVQKAGTAGAVGSVLMLRFSSTFVGTVASYTQIGESEVSVPVDSAQTFLDSGWIDLNNEVKTIDSDIFIAVVGSGGDGVLDPAFGNISAEFR